MVGVTGVPTLGHIALPDQRKGWRSAVLAVAVMVKLLALNGFPAIVPVTGPPEME